MQTIQRPLENTNELPGTLHLFFSLHFDAARPTRRRFGPLLVGRNNLFRCSVQADQSDAKCNFKVHRQLLPTARRKRKIYSFRQPKLGPTTNKCRNVGDGPDDDEATRKADPLKSAVTGPKTTKQPVVTDSSNWRDKGEGGINKEGRFRRLMMIKTKNHLS